MISPQVLFADEPTGNLDQETAAKVIDLLFELNREHGTTLVLVTHDPNSRSVVSADSSCKRVSWRSAYEGLASRLAQSPLTALELK